MKSFGLQEGAENSDKSIQEEKNMNDQSNQYDSIQVVNQSLQNSMVGSDKEVQI